MNLSALYNHIAAMLHTDVSVWTPDCRLLQRYPQCADPADPWLVNPDFQAAVFSDLADFPILAVINQKAAYVITPLQEGYCLIGPARLQFPENVYRQIEVKNCSDTEMNGLTFCASEDLLRYGLLLCGLWQDHPMAEFECAMRNYRRPSAENALKQHSESIYRFREEGQAHNSYAQEERMLKAIETGDFQLLQASRQEKGGGGMGVSSDDPIRNGKNLAETVIILASRACIRGGVDPEVAFSLCDAYMRQVEELQGMQEMMKLPALIESMQYKLTRMVHERKATREKAEQGNETPIIRSCKQYVSRHLHEKLTVQQIAEALSIHPNYLTSLFSKEEGVSLYQYILDEKLRTARELLIYSSKPIIEIAHTLAFSSQSHMGRLFRQRYGAAPREYRDSHGWAAIEQREEGS